jgi:WD40 repeat protein
MRRHEVICLLGAATALLGACGGSTKVQPDAGMTAPEIGLTPCRDLAPLAGGIVSAASSPHFLMTNTLGSSVIAIDGWRVLRTFTGQRGYMVGGAIAPDASWAATIGDDLAVRIWRTSDGKEIAHLDVAALPTAIAVSPTGDRIAVGDDGGAVTAVDPQSGAKQWSTVAAPGAVGSLHFAPDGKTLLVGTLAVFQWRDAASGSLVRSFPDPPLGGAGAAAGTGKGIMPGTALSVDGTRVAFAFGEKGGLASIQVMSTTDGTPIGSMLPNVNQFGALAFSNDGTQLVISGQLVGAIYDIATGTPVRQLVTNSGLGDVAVSADGKTLAASAFGVSFYRFSDGTLLNKWDQIGFGGMFARDGRRIEMPGTAVPGPTQIWDAATGTPLQQIPHETATGNQGSIIFTPSDQLLVIFNGTATTWDVNQGTVVSTVTLEGSSGLDTFTAALMTPDGRTLIGYKAFATTGDILFWDATTGALLRTAAHGLNLTALALNRTGDVLASAGPETGSDNVIKLWDVAQGTLIATLTGHTKQIDSVAFSPDGTLLISGDQYGLVRLWSVPGGQVVRDLATGPFGTTNVAGNNQFGRFVAFSPDGTKVASSGVDWRITNGHTGVIAIWSVADGSLVGNLHSLAEANLDHLLWSPAGDLLAAGTGMGMRVWCLDELAGATATAP